VSPRNLSELVRQAFGEDVAPVVKATGFREYGWARRVPTRRPNSTFPVRSPELVTINGVRVTTADGSWGLVRASSNKPEMVVVVESPVLQARMRDMFRAIDGLLREHPEVGRYNQEAEG
jgi:phosphomannomutase